MIMTGETLVEVAMSAGNIKATVTGVTLLLVAGAVYLWAVRGPVILLDLAAGFKGLLCF